MIISALPDFSADLGVDFGYFVRPRSRLIASIISGAVFIALMGLRVP